MSYCWKNDKYSHMIPDKYWRKTTYMEGHIVFDGIHIT